SELEDNTVTIKNMSTGDQIKINTDDVETYFKNLN
ncbi:MAG: hypothetical protein K2K84_08865, partial [Muribaculaceae bacterium]|nr:hypothetical protein [Muribaculaceae bacterium]